MSDENNAYSPGNEEANDTEKWEGRDPEIEREISLEEFQPIGTLTLTLIYFVIIVLMWLFMYFVEFAGHGPSIMN